MDVWITASSAHAPTPLITVDSAHFSTLIAELGNDVRQFCAANGFAGENGRFIGVPADGDRPPLMLAGCNPRDGVLALAALPLRLPEGDYQLDPRGLSLDPSQAALGWALGAYRFTRYRKAARMPARLVVSDAESAKMTSMAKAAWRVRDLINTPTEDMGPAHLAAEIRELAQQHSAEYRDWVGDELLEANFPTIHAVGRAAAADRAPRLAMLTHGKADAPHLVIIGKGVCFDTGGLDLKAADGMRWMKKDMGGAAHAIGLAALVLESKLPVRLTLLVPAVENAVSGNAMRPGEVIRTRGGHSVEIDNTDAEGRLVLCDALAFASEQKPDLILDFATLTGAARIALGPDLPALFANRDDIATNLLQAGVEQQDPLWRMPLWRPYLSMLDSYIADLANSGGSRHAGAITAALFLERFVPDDIAWCHLDVYSWNDSERPGRPRGGEAQGLRAYMHFLEQRYPR
jgi:leucyl aminopeptidase